VNVPKKFPQKGERNSVVQVALPAFRGQLRDLSHFLLLAKFHKKNDIKNLKIEN
jgi:hypothetical protein